jgi:hypothetical protein
MRARRSSTSLTILSLLVVAVVLAVAGSASSADHQGAWSWQTTPASAPTTLVASQLGSNRVTLTAVTDQSGGVTLVVRSDGTEIQAVSADSATDAPLVPFLVTGVSGGASLVGVARGDVGHVMLFTGSSARELPLNSANAFAAEGIAGAPPLRLQALAADGARIGAIVIPPSGAMCGGSIGACSNSPRAVAGGALPRAFLRPRRSSDALPKHGWGSNTIPIGTSRERILDTRQIASYTDGRGRQALLYLLQTKSVICDFTFWGSGAGGGCNPVSEFFGGRHLVFGTGHLLSGVGDDRVAKVVVVGSRGVRHPVVPSADGGFIYDCKAYNGCACVVDRVEGYDSAGQLVASQTLAGCSRKTTSASTNSADLRVQRAAALAAKSRATADVRVQRAAALAAKSARASGTIRWLFNHELRGQSLEAAGIKLGSTVGSHWQPVRFARALTPDPESPARIVLSLIGKLGRNICISVYPDGPKSTFDGGGGGCAVGLTLTPLSTTTAYGPSGGYIAGAADDRVARITLQLRNSTYANVPLHDNVFFLRIRPGTTPKALFSFDTRGHAIGHDILRAFLLPLRTGSGVVSLRPRGTQSIRTTPRYTVSNLGRLVQGRGNKIFQGHPYRIFLLGSVGGRAYYRVQLTPHYTCWGSGPTDTIGKVGTTGCSTVVGAYPLQFDDNAFELKRGAKTPHALRLAGIVADQATSVALRDANGKTIATVPVERNLFAFSPPLPNGFIRAVPLDANGKPLPPHPEWGQHQTPPLNFFGSRGVKASPSLLGKVVQRGEARGVTVSADQNGVVVFDARSINPAARKALGNRIAWFSCFQINGQNIRHNRSAGISTPFAAEVAFRTVGIKPRYDGCEAGGSYGHRWHDQYGPHSTLEFPLTAHGDRYFEDRATARDLAAFVRSAKTQAIRRKSGSALVAAIRLAYGIQIEVLHSPATSAQPGQVGVWTHGPRTVFSERSHLDDRFYVQFDHGRLTHENVRGLAFVF